MTQRPYCRMFFLLAACWALAPAPSWAVTMTIDYRYDGGFFGPGTQARATLEAATNFYSSILTDTLAAIQLPAPTFSGTGGQVTWSWTLRVNRPDGLGMASFTGASATVAADQIVIFPGSQLFTDNTLAVGGAGSSVVTRSGPPLSSFTSAEIAQINSIHNSVVSTVQKRGEPSGFATWSGSLSFDSDTPWHTNHLTPPAAGKVDLYSVAIHELAHVLGFGTSAEWLALVSTAGRFTGPTASALFGGTVPLAAGNSHWQDGLGSYVFGGSSIQTTSMSPGVTSGVRKRLTTLDAAALVDLGWSVVSPNSPTGDYNRDGVVNAADYTVWRNLRNQSMNLAADGNNNFTIDLGDYAVWKSHYGTAWGQGAGSHWENSPLSVPEPPSIACLLLTALIATRSRRRKK